MSSEIQCETSLGSEIPDDKGTVTGCFPAKIPVKIFIFITDKVLLFLHVSNTVFPMCWVLRTRRWNSQLPHSQRAADSSEETQAHKKMALPISLRYMENYASSNGTAVIAALKIRKGYKLIIFTSLKGSKNDAFLTATTDQKQDCPMWRDCCGDQCRRSKCCWEFSELGPGYVHTTCHSLNSSDLNQLLRILLHHFSISACGSLMQSLMLFSPNLS